MYAGAMLFWGPATTEVCCFTRGSRSASSFKNTPRGRLSQGGYSAYGQGPKSNSTETEDSGCKQYHQAYGSSGSGHDS
jgi:hypothetical protein